MVSILRALVVAGFAMFMTAGSANAIPVYDCDKYNEDSINHGVKFLQNNWDEFEKRIQPAGKDIVSCIKDRVFNTGTVSCDIYECPMPGLVGWTYKGKPDIYFCPWYYEERISHLDDIASRGACLGGNTASLFAISCSDVDSEHWDFYDAIFVEMMKEQDPSIKIDGMVDCGNNQSAPFTIKGENGKIFK